MLPKSYDYKDIRRQHGQMVGAPGLKFRKPKLKSCSDNQTDLSLIKLHSYPGKGLSGLPPASCGSC